MYVADLQRKKMGLIFLEVYKCMWIVKKDKGTDIEGYDMHGQNPTRDIAVIWHLPYLVCYWGTGSFSILQIPTSVSYCVNKRVQHHEEHHGEIV